MSTVHVTTVNVIAKGIQKYLKEKSNSSRRINVQHTFNIDEIEDERRFKVGEVAANINQLAETLAEPNLGLMAGYYGDLQSVPLHSSIVSRVSRGMKNGEFIELELSLLLVSRYIRISTEAYAIDYQIADGLLSIELKTLEESNTSYHQVEAAMAFLYKFLSRQVGNKLESILFRHEAPDKDFSAYLSVFKNTPEFSSDKNKLIFVIDKKYKEVKVDLAPVIAIGESMLQNQFPEESFENRCRGVLREILGFGEPSRKMMASIFHMSVSTLQRRLRDSNTSFKIILKEERVALAKNYLQEGALSCNDVAFLLGYQDPAQFYKTFKAEVGTSPLKYREEYKKIS